MPCDNLFCLHKSSLTEAVALLAHTELHPPAQPSLQHCTCMKRQSASLTMKGCIGRSLNFCEEKTGSETGFTTRWANAGMSGLLTNSEELQPCGLHSPLSPSSSSATECFSLFEVTAGSMACVPSCFLFDFFPCQYITHQKPSVSTPGNNIEIKRLTSPKNFLMMNGGVKVKLPAF